MTHKVRCTEGRRAALIAALIAATSVQAAAAVDGTKQPRAPDAAPPAVLGAHTLLGQEDGHGVTPAVTSPIATQATGSSLLAFSAGYTSNDNAPTDSRGNAWTQVGMPVFYEGYNGEFDVTPYVVLGAAGGAGHTVRIDKNGTIAGEITIPFVEIVGADRLQDVAQNYPHGPTLQSGTVTTTGPATLLAFWWGDGLGLTHTAVPNNGFAVIESFLHLPPDSAVQCAVAYKHVSGAGRYDVTWTQSDPGSPLWLFAFQSSDTIFASGGEVE